MQRFKPRFFILLGMGLILCGLGLALSSSQPAFAQGPEGAEYVGVQTCSSCHKDLSRIHESSRHALALRDVGSDKSAIKADFKTGEKERTVQFPEETEARPFTAEDVAYVIGSGRYVERYLYKTGRNKYAVFPAEWNVATKSWQPYVRAKAWPDPAYDWAQNCAGCHVTGLNVERGRWIDDGVQCETCHGPGSVHAETAQKAGDKPSDSDLKDVRAAVVLSPDAQICGQCHSVGNEPANKLPFPITYLPGKNLLDKDVFALVAPDDTDHWWATGHAKAINMQYNEWAMSGHAKSLTTLQGVADAPPECLSCHSADFAFTQKQIDAQKAGKRLGEAPAPVSLKTAKDGVTCVSCHDPHLDAKEAKVDFNLVSDTYTLCTSCHRDNEVTKGIHHPVQEIFEGKAIVKEVQPISSMHFTDKNGPKCQTCHLPIVMSTEGTQRTSHSLKPVPAGVIDPKQLKDSCTSCHTDTTPESMQKFVSDAQTSTKARVKAIKATVTDKTPAWVTTVIAAVEGDGSWGIHNHRYVSSLLTAVEKETGIVKDIKPDAPSNVPAQNPAECAECHQKQHQDWLNSPHAKASLSDAFRKEFADRQQPTYCMGCHASGYDPKTGQYVFEGVVCSNCHTTEANAKHPPAPVKVAKDSQVCGQCHSGAHAPTYDEWLVSKHNKAGIDCIDCHYAHNNGLRLGDVNATCGNCHKDAQMDKVHMKDNMTCVDCHMARKTDANGRLVVATGHSMLIEPGTCATCHGKAHLLSPSGKPITIEGQKEVDVLKDKVATLQETANTNWATGLAGGAIGMLIVGAVGFFILRRVKLL